MGTVYRSPLWKISNSTYIANGRVRLRALGKRISQLSDLVSAVPVQHAWIFKIIKQIFGNGERDVLTLKSDISKILMRQSSRILVIIDDIDRLTANEMSQMFRLIKVVADFPNITYLLSFDKSAVSEALTKAFDIPGEEYLEKIIQVPFDMPLLNQDALRSVLFSGLESILKDTPESLFDSTYWANVFLSGLDTFLRTPRDVARLLNTLNVTYRSLLGEVNAVDFIALEMLRILVPEVYLEIKEHSNFFVSSSNSSLTDMRDLKAYHNSYLHKLPDEKRESIKKLLVTLFPLLQSVWSNNLYGSEWEQTWRRDRRVCSADIIGYYLRWSVPDDTLSNTEMNTLLDNFSTHDEISRTFIRLTNTTGQSGQTKFRQFIERLGDYIDQIPEEKGSLIVSSLFDIGDRLLSKTDESTGMFEIGTDTRIGRVIWTFLRPYPENKRYEIIRSSISNSNSVYIPVREVAILGQEHGKNASNNPTPEEDQMVTSEHLCDLESIALDKIRKSASEGQLLGVPSLILVLYRWKEWDSEEAVLKWVESATSTNDKLVIFILQFLQYTHIRPINDRVGRRVPKISITELGHFLDIDTVITRIKALNIDDDMWTEEQKIALSELLTSYEIKINGGNPDDLFSFEKI